jgi:hypothetical protein
MLAQINRSDDKSWWNFSIDWTKYAAIFLYILMLVKLVFWFKSRRGVSLLSPATIATSLLLPKVQGFVLKSTSTVTPTEGNASVYNFYLSKMSEWATEVRFYERLSEMNAVFVLILIVVLIYIMCRLFTLRSTVYIDLVADSGVQMIRLGSLPNGKRCFRIIIPRGFIDLDLKNYIFFGILAFTSPRWILLNTVTGHRSLLSQKCLVSPWNMSTVAMILRDPSRVINALVVNSHEFIFNAATEETTRGGLRSSKRWKGATSFV